MYNAALEQYFTLELVAAIADLTHAVSQWDSEGCIKTFSFQSVKSNAFHFFRVDVDILIFWNPETGGQIKDRLSSALSSLISRINYVKPSSKALEPV